MSRPGERVLARIVAIVFVFAAMLAGVPAASSGGSSPFFVGFTDDLVKSVGSAAVAPAAGLGA